MTGPIDQIATEWQGIAARHRCARPVAEAVLSELVRAYSQGQRHYHTLDHIAALLRLVETHGAAITDRDAVVLAILFHDAVHDPTRHDNEAASAALARERLNTLRFANEVISKVSRYILATQHGHAGDMSGDADLAILLDFDLSILAAPPDEYLAYARAIRREYSMFPDELYRTGRRRVLEGFITQEHIYRTEPLHGLWEARARANIANEIAQLT
jgi:predicted metal-dependent HD superfamily phosphohydrolase